jgi:hypothetical protein
MPKSRCVVAAWLLLLLVSAGGEARGQVFKYVDDEGRVHFTDGYGAIPPKYRDQLEERTVPGRAPSASDSSPPIPSRPKSSEPAELDGMERFFADAFVFVVEQEGESLTAVERRAIEGWAADWGWAALWASTISSLVMLGMVVHAFITDRKMWGFAHFFVGFTAIPYLFLHVEKPMAVRLGLLLGVCSPIPVFFALFSRLIATV